MRRVLAFAGISVEISSEGPRSERIVAFALRHLPFGHGAAQAHLSLHDEGTSLVLRRDERLLLATASDGEALERTIRELTFTIADRSNEGPLVHGAFVVTAGHGLLLPGASGAGKSTLAYHLSRNGYALATDELVLVDPSSASGRGLARPVHLKPGVASLAPSDAGGIAAGGGAFVHACTFDGSAPIRAIVFPTYDANASEERTRLPQPTAARKLLETVANARNLAARAVPDVAMLARHVPAFSVRYRTSETAARFIAELLP